MRLELHFRQKSGLFSVVTTFLLIRTDIFGLDPDLKLLADLIRLLERTYTLLRW